MLLEFIMDQLQSIQPLLPIMPVTPSLISFPIQQRQSFSPMVTPILDDFDSVISSSIVSVNSNNSSLLVPVVIVTNSPYLGLSTDFFIGVNNVSAVPFSVVLPANPQTGKIYIVKDVLGTAQAENITITAVGHTIDGSSSAIINTNFGSITLVFDGAEWSLV